jgi:hypothetical protein
MIAKTDPCRLSELVSAAITVISVLNEATLLSIVIRSVVPHVLIHDPDGVQAPLARGLCLAAPLHRGVVLRRLLHQELGMLPVEEAFVVHAFRDPEHHLWLLSHSTKYPIEQELFRVVILIAEIHYVACLMLWLMMH